MKCKYGCIYKLNVGGIVMKLLIDAILDKGKILEGNILKVDTIINHQIDPVLMDEIDNMK